MVQNTPSGAKASLTSAASSPARLRSIRRDPNPVRVGFATGGPPVSRHARPRCRSSPPPAISPVIAPPPVAVERAPGFQPDRRPLRPEAGRARGLMQVHGGRDDVPKVGPLPGLAGEDVVRL